MMIDNQRLPDYQYNDEQFQRDLILKYVVCICLTNLMNVLQLGGSLLYFSTGTDEYYFHKYLKDVQRITGYLLVFSSTGLRDLSFLDSLVQIDGNHLWNDRYPTVIIYCMGYIQFLLLECISDCMY